MLVIVPVRPVTSICDGYGVAVPEAGIVIDDVLINLAAPGGSGLTVSMKLVFVLVPASVLVTVIVTVPTRPNAGVTVMYLAPTEPKNMFSGGTRDVSDEAPLNTPPGVVPSKFVTWRAIVG